ncbi:MAG TPA: hypothetical protein DCM87_00705 [Planctomycetes bacterium]|nr:hypothetical protein [Planctomycetota bacterium]
MRRRAGPHGRAGRVRALPAPQSRASRGAPDGHVPSAGAVRAADRGGCTIVTKNPGAHSGNDTAEDVVQIANRSGLHGRPTTMFVKLANRFTSVIKVHCDGEAEEVDGKSALGVLSLGMEYGKKLRIRAKGNDAREAVAALGALVRNKFAED